MASDGLTMDERDEMDRANRAGEPIICPNCHAEFDLTHIDGDCLKREAKP